MSITIRKSRPDDLSAIMKCYELARRYMRSQGNQSQWINGYPSQELVAEDIAEGRSYVGIDNEGDIVMAFSFVIGTDPTYTIIEDGKWLNDNVYGTIHRLGSTGKHKNVLATCVAFCEELVQELRLDTHEDNKTMRDASERAGFIRCGTIYCYDGTPRIAYHKSINNQ